MTQETITSVENLTTYQRAFKDVLMGALKLPEFVELRPKQSGENMLTLGFHDNFDQVKAEIDGRDLPDDNKADFFFLDVDGVFYKNSEYFKPLSEDDVVWLQNLRNRKNTQVFVVSSRRKEATKLIDKRAKKRNIETLENQLREVFGEDRVFTKAKRQKPRNFDEVTKKDEEYSRFKNEFEKVCSEMSMKDGINDVTVNLVADNGHATSYSDSDK